MENVIHAPALRNVITALENVPKALNYVITALDDVITALDDVITALDDVITALDNVIPALGNVIAVMLMSCNYSVLPHHSCRTECAYSSANTSEGSATQTVASQYENYT